MKTHPVSATPPVIFALENLIGRGGALWDFPGSVAPTAQSPESSEASVKGSESLTETPLTFAARDGVSLSGYGFFPASPARAVLIATGTGIPARFYRSFARWLAEQGQASLVFDYRGIGLSKVGALSECAARKQDWGQRDLPAALDELAHRAPGLPLGLVGHSAGGQLIGLMDNWNRLDRIVQVASSSGFLGGLRFPFRPLAKFLMHVYAPLSIRTVGYVASERLGWGENLPAEVARQWTFWCSRPGYVENDFGKRIEAHYYHKIECPLLSFSSVDDPIATDTNVNDMLRLFPSAVITKERIDPSDHGLASIGHVGFFRRPGAIFWPRLLRFLNEAR